MAAPTTEAPASTEKMRDLAQQLRVDSIRMSTAAGSGHPTSSMSAADLMAVLMSKYLRYDFDNPQNPMNDHLIFSKGHASPLLYSMFKAAGAISDKEMMTFRKFGSRMEGHPTPALPWVDVATGSLGQGLPIGVGIALAGKYLDKLPYRIWVLLGDSEMAEGSIWEAQDHASHYHLSNLIGVLDMNRLGQRGETELGWDGAAYADRAHAFGWYTIQVDGHDIAAVDDAFAEAASHSESGDQPILIIAKTIKGKGVSFLENKNGWHGKALDEQQAKEAIKELGGERDITIQVNKPEPAPAGWKQPHQHGKLEMPTYKVGDSVATRKGYGDALAALKAWPDVVALDGEVSNSTYSEEFKEVEPGRFFEMYIAEQQMVAAAVGFSARHYIPFASTFAAFMTRAYDFIRMGAISQANIRLCGSHAGVSIGEDGPSQMGLEDLAMMRAVHNSTVLYPSDPNQTAQLVRLMAEQQGISYLRTTREKTPVLYSPDESFTIGGSKVVRQSDKDQVTVVAAGITLHEALKAYDTLRQQGINIRLIDTYSVKPIDSKTLHEAVQATGGRIVVVEDHWPEGGLGEAVLEAFTNKPQVGDDKETKGYGGPGPVPLNMTHLAVRIMEGSGKPEELLNAAGIDAEHIVAAVKALERS